MPDLQSELSKLAHAWDNHEDSIRNPNQTQPKQENNVTTTNTASVTTTITYNPNPAPGKAGAPVRNNVMRTCFAEVHNQPGKTRTELVEHLSSQGFKETSTSAVFSQLIRTGQIIKADDGTLHPNPAIKEYRPITLPSERNLHKKARALAKQQAKKPKEKKVKAVPAPAPAGIAALEGGTAATVAVNTDEKRGLSTIIVSRNWTPESVIDKLTLPQAKALYAALHVYFGK